MEYLREELDVAVAVADSCERVGKLENKMKYSSQDLNGVGTKLSVAVTELSVAVTYGEMWANSFVLIGIFSESKKSEAPGKQSNTQFLDWQGEEGCLESVQDYGSWRNFQNRALFIIKREQQKSSLDLILEIHKNSILQSLF